MILRSIARMLIQEHQYRPITGRVLCLGPQLVPMHRGQVDELFETTPAGRASAMERWRRDGADTSPVSDEYFFRKFPIEALDSLDVVEGFGGNVIHDLNTPIPESLHGRYDFILDGGTFDHLVNVGIGFSSVIDMLKPGGRVLHYNAASGYLGAAYVTFGPDLFFDYYTVNGFVDCKIYVVRETDPDPNAPWDVFYVPDGRTKALNSAKHQMVVALAEKGKRSVSNRVPVEHTYRSADMHHEFTARQRKIRKSPRPLLRTEHPFPARVHQSVISLGIAVRYAHKRYRAGKFEWTKIRERIRLGRHSGYLYLGRL